MFSSAKTSYRNKPRRPLRYVGFLLLVMNLGGLEGLRTDMSRTSASGRVFFWPSVHASLLPAWRGILDQSDRSRRADCPAMRILYRMDGLKGKRMAY
jgi:hypothetical protein